MAITALRRSFDGMILKKSAEAHPSRDKLDHGKWARSKFTVVDRSRQRADVLVSGGGYGAHGAGRLRRVEVDRQCVLSLDCRLVWNSGLPYELNAMFTLVEGEWDEVMDVVRRAVEAAGVGAARTSLVLKADIRAGYAGQLRAKVDRVERHLST